MDTENSQFVTKEYLKETLRETFQDFFEKIVKHVDYKIEIEMAKMKAFVMEGFTAMGERMDHIEERIDSMDVRLRCVEEAVVPVRRIRR